MNRKMKRKAEKDGVPAVVTFPNLITGSECSIIVVWGEDFNPILTFVDNNQVVYAVPALELLEATGKLTREALDRFKKTIKESQ